MEEGHTIILNDCLKRIGELEDTVKGLRVWCQEFEEEVDTVYPNNIGI